MIRFQAHGKLLLSAEYMVMHGATALAVPLKKGQTLANKPYRKQPVFYMESLL